MNIGYGYVAAGILLGLIAVFLAGDWHGRKAERATCEAAMSAHLLDDQTAAALQTTRVLNAERALSDAQAGATAAYNQGLQDADAKNAAVVAGLRAGNLKLRDQWTTCQAASGVPATSSGSAGTDAAADDRAASAGRIVRAAAECDAQVSALQGILAAEREGQ